MTLKAHVTRVTGATQHSIGGLIEGRLVEKEKLPDAAWVHIEAANGAFFLIRHSATGEFAGDTWHETLEDAKDQARREYEIKEEDWFKER